jgi:hypothetical protein
VNIIGCSKISRNCRQRLAAELTKFQKQILQIEPKATPQQRIHTDALILGADLQPPKRMNRESAPNKIRSSTHLWTFCKVPWPPCKVFFIRKPFEQIMATLGHGSITESTAQS